MLIFIHKEQELECVESIYPARHYVMVDDKLRLLEAIKDIWKDSVTTVFVQQGHYARDKKAIAQYRPADISIGRIADLLEHKRTEFMGAVKRRYRNESHTTTDICSARVYGSTTSPANCSTVAR